MKAVYKCEGSEFGFVNDLVNRFLVNELPGIESKTEDLVDKISELFMGSRTIRLAGCPAPESQVLIRSIIRSAITQNKPIPILSAAGPKKPNSGNIDLAEFSVIQRIVCLQENISKYYAPGIDFRFRLEDVSGLFFESEIPDLKEQMNKYCGDFSTLCSLLEDRIGGKFITAWRESQQNQAGTMSSLSETYLPDFEFAFETGDCSKIEKLGWTGGVENWKPVLFERYGKLYPQWNEGRVLYQAAKYLSNTLARHHSKMSGATSEWVIDGKYLEISFATPSPGAPTTSTRVFYRTMSTKQTKTHIPYWRSKGFFRLVDGVLKMGLVSANNSGTYIPGKLILSTKKGQQLEIQADFK